ncbi:MAG: hypothetical protein ACJAS4_000930 [Bacteriovoracaceae bacterium]
MKLLFALFILSISNAYAIRNGLEENKNVHHVHITLPTGICSGVRISTDFVLSVGHCFNNTSDTAFLSFYEDSELVTQTVPVKDIIIKGKDLSEELAIIPIRSTNTNYIGPKISLKKRFRTRDIFKASGYGLKLDGTYGKLNKGYLNFEAYYRPLGRVNMLIMVPSSRDQLPCAGDSGGALFSVKNNELVGLASFINHTFTSMKGMTALEKCSAANTAYYIQLNQHLPFLSRYLDTTNRP